MIASRWPVVPLALAALVALACGGREDGSVRSDSVRAGSPRPGETAAGRTARSARTAPGLASADRGSPAPASGQPGLASADRGSPAPASGQPGLTSADRGSPAAGDRPVVLFLGTSLTAGLGLDPDEAYPARIQEKLDSAGLQWRVVNGGVSGETSAGALRRLEWMLRPGVSVLVVETGANDGLRGLDVDSTRANLEAIVARIRAYDPGVRIVLAGMEAPPNLGARFTARFRAMFRDLARRERLPLIPFILEGVGGVDSLNQGDGIHPNVRGARIVAANVWRVLEPEVREAYRGTGVPAYRGTGVPGHRNRP